MTDKTLKNLILLCGLLNIICHLRLALDGAPHFNDDAYYYVIPAQQWWELGFYSFDNHEPTNGFHPLWAWISTIAVFPFQTKGEIEPLVSIVAVQCILYFSALFLSVKFYFHSNQSHWHTACGGIIAWLIYPQVTDSYLINGMETMLALLLLVLVLWSFTSERWKVFSLCLPLLVLSRLDSLVFICGPLLLYVLFDKGNLRSLKRKALVAMPLLSIFSLYAFSNWINFGHIKPISGTLKSSFPFPTFHFNFILDEWILYSSKGSYLGLLSTPNIITFILLIVISAALLLHKFSLKKLILWLIPLGFLLNILLFQKWNKSVGTWYFVLPFGSAIFLLAQQLAAIFGRKKMTLLLMAMLVISIPMHIYRSTNLKTNTEESLVNLVEFIKINTAPDAIIAGTDVGYISYFCKRDVVNLDGLINNYRYQEYLKDGKLSEYLAEKNVSYLIEVLLDGEQPFRTQGEEKMYFPRIDPTAVSGDYQTHLFNVYSYAFLQYSEPVTLKASQEVFRGKERKFGFIKGARVLYRLTAE